jgi:hypothetical protein
VPTGLKIGRSMHASWREKLVTMPAPGWSLVEHRIVHHIAPTAC